MYRALIVLSISLAAFWIPASLSVAEELTVAQACSLAEAIVAANSDSAVGGCPAGAGADTILLTSDQTLTEELPVIASAITIEGHGFSIDGDGKRVFSVNPEGDLQLFELEVTGGFADETSALCFEIDEGEAEQNEEGESEDDEEVQVGYGGAICVDRGAVRISSSRFVGNTVKGHGGAIFILGGRLEILESEFDANVAEGSGGGVFARGSRVTISDSAFTNNQSSQHGGALLNREGRMEIADSAFSGNQAAEYGGAIDNIVEGDLAVSSSTFTSNQATTGGAIGNWQSQFRIDSSQFRINTAEDGGAIQSEDGHAAICESEFDGNSAVSVGAAVYGIRGTLSAASNVFSANSAGDGGIIHIIEPEAATLNLSANRFADNEGDDCVGCQDASAIAETCATASD